MGTLTKVFVVLNLVFSVAFVTVAAVVLAQRTHWKEAAVTLENKYKQEKRAWEDKEREYTKELDRKADDLQTKDQSLTDLRQQLDDKNKIIALRDEAIQEEQKRGTEADARADRLSQTVKSVTANLLDAQRELDQTQAALAKAKKTIDERNTTLMGQKAQNEALERKQRELLSIINEKNEDLAALKRFKSFVSAENRALAMRAEKEAGTGTAPPPDRIAAVVKAVDMGIGVVVLNVGSDHEPPVKKGYEFLVHREGDLVAVLRVTRVTQKACAAEIIEPTPQGTVVRVGDAAVTKY
jgi:hypothetical protein